MGIAASSAACGSNGFAGFHASSDTVYVGVAVGLSSPERYVNVFKGVQLALDQLNESRPEGAPPLGMRRAPSDAKSPVDVAAAFRDDPAVVGVVGHTESDPTITAAPLYDDRSDGGKRALIAISPTAASREVTLASDWIFRVCPGVDRQAQILAKYMSDSLELAHVAIVYRNDVAGREFLQAFVPAMSAGKVIERDPFVEEIDEFDLYARRLARSKPDGVVVYANSNDVLEISRALHAAGINPIIVSTNGPSAQDLRDTSAARAFHGLRYLSLYSPAQQLTPASPRFVGAYTREFNAAPDHWAALSYDAAMLIGRAMQAVGPDRAAIRAWVAKVGHGAPAFDGATGAIAFDDSRNPVNKPAIVTTVTQ